jgi:hypothetical protein
MRDYHSNRLHSASPSSHHITNGSAADGARPIRFDRSCKMRMRKLGALEVSELGFGALSFASTHGQAQRE